MPKSQGKNLKIDKLQKFDAISLYYRKHRDDPPELQYQMEDIQQAIDSGPTRKKKIDSSIPAKYIFKTFKVEKKVTTAKKAHNEVQIRAVMQTYEENQPTCEANQATKVATGRKGTRARYITKRLNLA